MAVCSVERFRGGVPQLNPTRYVDAECLVIQWQTFGTEPNVSVKWEQLIEAIDMYYGYLVNNIMFQNGKDGSTGNIKSPEDWGMEWSNEAMNVIERFQAWSSRQAVSGFVEIRAGTEEPVSLTPATSMSLPPQRKRKRLNFVSGAILLTRTSV